MGAEPSKEVEEATAPATAAPPATAPPRPPVTSPVPIPIIIHRGDGDETDDEDEIIEPPSPTLPPRKPSHRSRHGRHAAVAQNDGPPIDSARGFCQYVLPAILSEMFRDGPTACILVAMLLIAGAAVGFSLGRLSQL